MSDADYRCPSCGVKYSDHLGIIGTCALLQSARDAMKRQRQLALSKDRKLRAANIELRTLRKKEKRGKE